jgi:uncharacterized protein YjbI with pentapeptide repeats
MAASSVEPAAPRISSPRLPDLADVDGNPEPGAEYEAIRFSSVGGTVVDASRCAFYECRFEHARAGTIVSAPAAFVDVEVTRPDIIAWTASSSRWRRAEIAQGRIGSLDLAGATLDGVRFAGVRIGHAGFRAATLTDVEFLDCTFESLDLAGAALTRVSYRSCRAREADLSGCSGADLDLRGLDFDAVDGIATARGTTISTAQLALVAPVLASAAGLRVLD